MIQFMIGKIYILAVTMSRNMALKYFHYCFYSKIKRTSNYLAVFCYLHFCSNLKVNFVFHLCDGWMINYINKPSWMGGIYLTVPSLSICKPCADVWNHYYYGRYGGYWVKGLLVFSSSSLQTMFNSQ